MKNTKNDVKNITVCKEKLSPYWIGQWTDPRGVRVRRSTKVPVKGGLYRGEHISAAGAKKKALLVAYEMAHIAEEDYAGHDNTSVKEVFDKMLHGKLGRVSMATYQNAGATFKFFAAHVGERVMKAPVREVTRAMIRDFADARRREVRSATVRKDLCALNAAFRYAAECEIIAKNPCEGIRAAADTKEEKVLHEAFTLDEVRLLLAKLPEEWAGAVRVCLGTYGQRLRDCLNLRWDAVDWKARTVRIVTGKTGRVLVQPMQGWFYEWMRARHELARMAEGTDAREWVLPCLRLNKKPSYEFTQLVRAHGIGLVGRGIGGRRRVWHSKTFHSLRATVATMLQAAGVAQGMAMELVGHESAAVHAAYIRPTGEQLRSAAAKLPDFISQ